LMGGGGGREGGREEEEEEEEGPMEPERMYLLAISKAGEVREGGREGGREDWLD